MRKNFGIIVAALLSIMLIFTAWDSYTEYQTALESFKNQKMRDAHTLAEHASRTFGEVLQVLSTLEEDIGERGGTRHFTEKELYDNFKRKMSDIPQIVSIGAIDHKGMIICSTVQFPVPRMDVSANERFVFHSGNATEEALISRPYKGKLDDKWRFTISRRISNVDGTFSILAVALLEDYFNNFYSTLGPLPSERICLIRDDGYNVVTSPFQEQIIESNHLKSLLFTEHLPVREAGAFRDKNAGLDHSDRIIAYHAVDGFPVVAVISTATEEMLAPWKKTSLTKGLMVAVFSLVVVGFTMILNLKIRQLSDEHELTQAIIQNTLTGILAYRVDTGDCILANEASAHLIGAPVDQLLGQNFHKLESWKKSGLYYLAKQAIETQKAVHGTIDIRTTFGKNLCLDCVLSLFNSNDQPHLLLVAEDITERKQAELELLQSEKHESLALMAGSIAHNFNNILAVVKGNTELLLETLPKNSEEYAFAKEIEISSARAANVARQMGDFAGFSTGGDKSFNVSETIAEASEKLRDRVPANVSIDLDITRDVPPITGEPKQVALLLRKLVQNSVESIGENQGRISISTGVMECDEESIKEQIVIGENLSPGKYVFAEISDNGKGMDADTQKKIFDPFFTTHFYGRGLGLAAVLGIVRGHNGSIVVKSKLNAGTSFLILFPISA